LNLSSLNSPSYREPSDKNIFPVTMQREKLLKKGNPYAAELYLNHWIYDLWILLHIESPLIRIIFLLQCKERNYSKKGILMLPNCTLTIVSIIFKFSFISRAIYQEFLSYFEWKEINFKKKILILSNHLNHFKNHYWILLHIECPLDRKSFLFWV